MGHADCSGEGRGKRGGVQELFALTPAEQKLLLERCCLIQSFWISPAAVSGRAYWVPRPSRFLDKAFFRVLSAQRTLIAADHTNLRKRSKFNFINFDPICSTPLEDGVRYASLADLIDGKPLSETRLFTAVTDGRSLRRRFERDGQALKAEITGGSSLEEYHAQCLALIDSIRCDGVMNADEPEGRSKARAGAISLAVSSDGALLHYTKGSHRLLIAKLLQLDRIPVTIRCISGDYFRRFVRQRDLFSENRLLAAICAAGESAKCAVALER